MLLSITSSLSFSPALKGDAASPCCAGACTETGTEKYFSVDVKHGFCGETCMKPSSYPVFKVFEANLTKAETDSPCKDQFTPVGTHYTEYNGTVTHGVWPLSITLSLIHI